MTLSDNQTLRYNRQILLPEVGLEGQEKLKAASILIVGLGGLGSPAAMYLAAAGVGTLGLMDGDVVELSNLGRQIIHPTSRIGTAKVLSAAQTLKEINPEINIQTYAEWLSPTNAPTLLGSYQYIIEATDQFSSKYLINDTCLLMQKNFTLAGVVQWSGQMISVQPGTSACYRCFFPNPPDADEVPTCSTAGILGPVAGILGTWQALEALKFFLAPSSRQVGALHTYDFKTNETRAHQLTKLSHCPACAEPLDTAGWEKLVKENTYHVYCSNP